MPKRQTQIPNPTSLAKRHGFVLDIPINPNSRRHIGTCACGTRGSLSYDSLLKGKFCRNLDCVFYQPAKRVDNDEIKEIIKERGCEFISITGHGVNSIVKFTCVCGMEQEHKWVYLNKYNKNWCIDYSCKFHHAHKQLNTDIVRKLFEKEGYIPPTDLNYDSKYQSYNKLKFLLKCPKNHDFECSVQMWVDGARCKVCNGNGRSFSYDELKERYNTHNCELLLKPEEFKANCTNNKIPYKCPRGHIISNLTKNVFNSRINQKLGPCAICNKEDMKNTWGVEHPMQIPLVFDKQKKTGEVDYKLPSGKIVKIQGAEPLCLDILLEEYDETDIEYDAMNMPDIWYIHPRKKKRARYFVDFFVPKDNLVIEVKSTYTYFLKWNVNISKFQACVDSGYRLKIYIFNGKKLNNVIDYLPNSTILDSRMFIMTPQFEEEEPTIDVTSNCGSDDEIIIDE